MKYWIVVGINKYDRLVVAADTLRIDSNVAIFESNDKDLVVALNTTMWSNIQPMTPDQYFSSNEPQIRQRKKDTE